jgi:hypothetical protein
MRTQRLHWGLYYFDSIAMTNMMASQEWDNETGSDDFAILSRLLNGGAADNLVGFMLSGIKMNDEGSGQVTILA